MELTNADRESNTWQKLKAHYEARLDRLRRQNDGRMNEEDRSILIGQITEIKILLTLEHVEQGIQL